MAAIYTENSIEGPDLSVRLIAPRIGQVGVDLRCSNVDRDDTRYRMLRQLSVPTLVQLFFFESL